MLNFGRSHSWTASSRRRGRGLSFDVTAVLDSNRFPPDTEHQVGMILPIPTLSALCLRSLESSLGKGLATFSLYELPLGLVEKIYEFVCLKGSRMAQMELSRALAPILSEHVNSLDFNSGAAKFLGDSALCELANGCGSGLVRLDLSACRFVTDAGVLGALLRCPAIRLLSLSGCDGVTDEVRVGVEGDSARLFLAGLWGCKATFFVTFDVLCASIYEYPRTSTRTYDTCLVWYAPSKLCCRCLLCRYSRADVLAARASAVLWYLATGTLKYEGDVPTPRGCGVSDQTIVSSLPESGKPLINTSYFQL